MKMDTCFIQVAGLVNDSIVDGPGLRYTVFTQGCPHNCKGCHNQNTHPLVGGELISVYDILDKIKDNPLLSGVTFSGGEPMLYAKELAVLAREIKKLGLSLIVYTGFTLEELIEKDNKDIGYKELLRETDVLVDGRFDITRRDLNLLFRGSTNQRCIKVKEYFKSNTIKELTDDEFKNLKGGQLNG